MRNRKRAGGSSGTKLLLLHPLGHDSEPCPDSLSPDSFSFSSEVQISVMTPLAVSCKSDD
jgi:hypothetical protein